MERQSAIPEKLMPLYQATTAWGVIEAAKKIISETSKEEQMFLFLSNEFNEILNSAIYNLDQRREKGIKEVSEAFDNDLQETVSSELLEFFSSL